MEHVIKMLEEEIAKLQSDTSRIITEIDSSRNYIARLSTEVSRTKDIIATHEFCVNEREVIKEENESKIRQLQAAIYILKQKISTCTEEI